MKIVTVVGARPQFVKAATVSRAVTNSQDKVTEVLVHTGQHYDANMSEIFFNELNIPKPDYHLGIGGGLHGEMTGKQLEAVEKVLLNERPDWVLVYGDTNSTLAGALAASKLHIPVAHIEAGLRSFNRKMPEEINRVLTDHCSELLFSPTDVAASNLLKEGVSEERVLRVGDVMYDAALFYKERAVKPAWFDELGLHVEGYVLATIHRAENTDAPANMENILSGLGATNIPVVLPIHPRTKERIQKFGLPIPSNVIIVDPVGYLEMVWLESRCRLIATDSGGVQKEAYFFGKRCVTLRGETEWTELVDSGWNTLVGADVSRIKAALAASEPEISRPPLYGDGNAAAQIIQALVERS